MRRLLSLLACLIAIGGSAVAGVSAHAEISDVDAAYCPYGSVSGTGSWSPPETTTTAAHTFAWNTFAVCTGNGDDSGVYQISFNGASFDSCVTGNGNGNLSGTGPEGAISGSFTFRKIGIHLYISGDFFSAGEEHSLQYWLDVLPLSGDNSACNYSSATLIGHGAITDWTLLPVPPPAI